MVNSESLAKGLVEGSRRLDWLRHQPTLPKGYGPQCVLDKRTCRGSKGLRLVEDVELRGGQFPSGKL